jgi:hypothetical protein
VPITTVCGFCNEATYPDITHICDAEYYFEKHNLPTGKYYAACSPAEFFEARDFIKAHPELFEQNDPLVTAFHTASTYFNTVSEEPESYTLPDNLPVVDTTANIELLEDFDRVVEEWDGIYDNRDNYQTARPYTYRDLEPTRCTHAAHWFTTNQRTPTPYGHRHMPNTYTGRKYTHPRTFTEGETYNATSTPTDFESRTELDNGTLLDYYEFEELQGFITERLIDLNITEAYQYRFFNIYMGRDGNLHVGLLTFTQSADGRPQVTCNHKGCYYRTKPFVFTGDLTDRNAQEDFIHACIRHGNNHGPDWYRSRPDYAFIHASNCDASHNQDQPCNANAPRIPFTTASVAAAQDFLIQHRKYCRSTKCRCTHYYHLLNERLNYPANRKKVAA